ncbi:hypothetical protein ACOME3_004186 [Neoechinorhynchus agilis]
MPFTHRWNNELLQQHGLDLDENLFRQSSSIDVFSISLKVNPIKDSSKLLGTSERLFLADGTTFGRNGKGSSFVVLSNSCNDIVNSRHTIGVAGISKTNSKTFSVERCASAMTSVLIADIGPLGIVTGDRKSGCRVDFVGWSSAAPSVAAIIGLGLEANPKLSSRQIQHLIVFSSRPKLPTSAFWNSDGLWWKNGAGLWVSDVFGFGVLDAEMFIRGAKFMRAEKLFDLRTCRISFNNIKRNKIEPIKMMKFKTCTTACNYTNSAITRLEHVELQIDILPDPERPGRRGNLNIIISSPQGHPVSFVNYRDFDSDQSDGFKNRTLTSVLHWLEDPRGCWSVEITNMDVVGAFILNDLSIDLYGTF